MLTRWDDLERNFAWMNELRRQLDSVFGGTERDWSPQGRSVPLTGSWPRVNLFDMDSKMVLQAEVPGLSQDEVNLTVHQDVITFAGERKSDAPEGYTVHRQERRPFKFSRSFKMPYMVDPEKVRASMKDGILTVEMEKIPEAQPRQISITSGK